MQKKKPAKRQSRAPRVKTPNAEQFCSLVKFRVVSVSKDSPNA